MTDTIKGQNEAPGENPESVNVEEVKYLLEDSLAQVNELLDFNSKSIKKNKKETELSESELKRFELVKKYNKDKDALERQIALLSRISNGDLALSASDKEIFGDIVKVVESFSNRPREEGDYDYSPVLNWVKGFNEKIAVLEDTLEDVVEPAEVEKVKDVVERISEGALLSKRIRAMFNRFVKNNDPKELTSKLDILFAGDTDKDFLFKELGAISDKFSNEQKVKDFVDKYITDKKAEIASPDEPQTEDEILDSKDFISKEEWEKGKMTTEDAESIRKVLKLSHFISLGDMNLVLGEIKKDFPDIKPIEAYGILDGLIKSVDKDKDRKWFLNELKKKKLELSLEEGRKKLAGIPIFNEVVGGTTELKPDIEEGGDSGKNSLHPSRKKPYIKGRIEDQYSYPTEIRKETTEQVAEIIEESNKKVEHWIDLGEMRLVIKEIKKECKPGEEHDVLDKTLADIGQNRKWLIDEQKKIRLEKARQNLAGVPIFEETVGGKEEKEPEVTAVADVATPIEPINQQPVAEPVIEPVAPPVVEPRVIERKPPVITVEKTTEAPKPKDTMFGWLKKYFSINNTKASERSFKDQQKEFGQKERVLGSDAQLRIARGVNETLPEDSVLKAKSNEDVEDAMSQVILDAINGDRYLLEYNLDNLFKQKPVAGKTREEMDKFIIDNLEGVLEARSNRLDRDRNKPTEAFIKDYVESKKKELKIK